MRKLTRRQRQGSGAYTVEMWCGHGKPPEECADCALALHSGPHTRQEIAKILGWSVATVAEVEESALKKLRDGFAEMGLTLEEALPILRRAMDDSGW